jgi:NAD(P)-dependent dehydrogenase (short-subunit alcohol dehydrogenase family)
VAGAIVKTTMNAAIEAATKVLAKELSPLRVNVVSPGLTDTEAYAGMDAAARKNARWRGGNPASQSLGKGGGHRARVSFRH